MRAPDKEHPMSCKIVATLVLALCATAVAQKTDDTDKQKLIDIEQKFAAVPSFNSPEMTDAFQKYLYDGTTSVAVFFGHLFRGPKLTLLPRRNQIPMIPT
jgi:hypothetical protein